MLRRLRGPAVLVAAGAALLVAAALALVRVQGPDGTRITVYFRSAVGISAGSDVRVLGVRVGAIDSVTPEGPRVRTVLTVDHGVRVPSGAKAVAIAPSVVADRYVQLTPAYTGGPVLRSGGVIDVRDTATPMELDQVYAAVERLAGDLGPGGVNADGALSRALETGAENLDGNGRDIRTTTERMAQAAKTLSGSQHDLFATIRSLQTFTSMLRENDGQVRRAERQLADVSEFLAADRHELDAAIRLLTRALADVEAFIRDNRQQVRENVHKLSDITRTLVKQRRSLAEALDVQAINVVNVLGAYDPATKSLMGRQNLTELTPLPVTGRPVRGEAP
ncbi:MCE family protein [Actinomadura sp. WMMB 499]|uniref:MCE family protein n=1 Tax=Actinomadura sp. WMMB 499 TaxID=1219491 RepID=UPI0012448A1D|nr:MCE family protein [Actinomadura sp. WMMB 499]QFG23668.1 MCE family protein [Actinomadura sp. WMMB 499]